MQCSAEQSRVWTTYFVDAAAAVHTTQRADEWSGEKTRSIEQSHKVPEAGAALAAGAEAEAGATFHSLSPLSRAAFFPACSHLSARLMAAVACAVAAGWAVSNRCAKPCGMFGYTMR
jgi:hypothetical protein